MLSHLSRNEAVRACARVRTVAVPEQPTNLQGEARSPNSIQLTWDAPELSADELIDSYELYYNDSHFRQNVHVTIAPARNAHLLVDLTPDTVYHVRVAARSARGEGASTPTVQVRTLDYGTRHFASSRCVVEQSNSGRKSFDSIRFDSAI